VAIGYGRKRFRKKTNGTNGDVSSGKSNGHKESQEKVFFWKKIIIFEDPCSIFRAYLSEDELDERWHGWSDHGTFTGGEPLVLMKFGIAVYGRKLEHGSKKITKMP
jgi:hypothetical protein